MDYSNHIWSDLGVTAQLSTFRAGEVVEHHAILHVAPRTDLFPGQYERIAQAESRLMAELPAARAVFKRYLVSDSTNQSPLIAADGPCAVSIIQQAPLDGSKVALWIYMVEGAEVTRQHGHTICTHNGYQHLWRMGMSTPEGDSAQQTTHVLTDYEQSLSAFSATLAQNCIRTWFYVRDVDTQYAGMVRARRENFIEQGLTPDTHYIASTGIQGLPADRHALIQLGAYALTGFQPEQQRYVRALTHLNPTIEYGVTFERGTVVEYGDRAHCYISGTASINNRGEVVHIGDVVRQTERMWENVGQLLQEGEFTEADIAQIIVYLRDTADYDTISRMFAERYPHIPTVITLAPVCRPEWLIEMECIAITQRSNAQYRDF